MSSTISPKSSNEETMIEGQDTSIEKKKKFWRNCFLVGLTISLAMVFPEKITQLNEFINSPSVDLPQKVDTKDQKKKQAKQSLNKNLLPTNYAMVNASADDKWIYYDLSSGAAVKIMDPSSLEWDLAFRRSQIITNGGATNRFGKAGLHDMGEVPFDEVLEVPSDGYIADVATKTETENPVLLKWFKYNFLTHKLTAKKNIYAFKTADDKFAKIQFVSFNCDNEETGCIRFQYAYQDNGTNSFMKNKFAQEVPTVQEEKS